MYMYMYRLERSGFYIKIIKMEDDVVAFHTVVYYSAPNRDADSLA